MSFAVIDFETTGLVPERTDRVIEVGIVLVDLDGRMESEWTTLVSPSRDVGASHINGLTAADLLDAFAHVFEDAIEAVTVGSHADWLAHSDHSPMTVDLRV
jgi:DNA polymerase-3 subunit epsilon